MLPSCVVSGLPTDDTGNDKQEHKKTDPSYMHFQLFTAKSTAAKYKSAQVHSRKTQKTLAHRVQNSNFVPISPCIFGQRLLFVRESTWSYVR